MTIKAIENFLERNGWTRINRYSQCNTFIKKGVHDIRILTGEKTVSIDFPSIRAFFVVNNWDCFIMGGFLNLGDGFMIEDHSIYNSIEEIQESTK